MNRFFFYQFGFLGKSLLICNAISSPLQNTTDKNGMALDIDKNYELRIPHTVDCVILYKLVTSYLNWHTIAIDRYDNKTRLRFR